MRAGHGLLPAVATVLLGMLIALQSRINGELAVHVSTGLFPAWWTSATGLVVLVGITAIHGPTRRAAARIGPSVRAGVLPWLALTGGILGAVFLVTQSVVVPLVGVAVFSVGVVAGQTSGSLLVDRLGISASGVVHITARRVLAAVLAVVAVGISISDRLSTTSETILYAVLAVVAGALIAPQQAANGRVSVATASPFAAALVNFVGGALALSVALGLGLAVSAVDVLDPWGAPWWAYIGGALGLSVIAGAAWAVPSLGVLVFSLLSVLGQLAGSLLLDVVAPTAGTSVGWHLVAGVALTFVAVLIAAGRRLRGRISL